MTQDQERAEEKSPWLITWGRNLLDVCITIISNRLIVCCCYNWILYIIVFDGYSGKYSYSSQGWQSFHISWLCGDCLWQVEYPRGDGSSVWTAGRSVAVNQAKQAKRQRSRMGIRDPLSRAILFILFDLQFQILQVSQNFMGIQQSS